ncbi:DUF6191 domain-containing protein [Streptomyces sp. WMMB 322]|uniref:DUF6191 domain-containing protein n=1 Tax=Streptomyces sp. WMMB 322 TaxID=1286821 RepID=UPI0006E2F61C|nr:DUF6191 domain-containing protein [Streptomyces sp. WMMB 322]SCK34661.1 hypothetical protein H180DRAFT_02854 [Streptomyces sp. WMMB 322]
MFNLIEELFSPGRRHTDDERRRLEHTRVEEGSNDPGQGPIDLSSGRVLIRPREEQATHTTDTDTDTTGTDTANTDTTDARTDHDGDRSR